MKIKYKNNIYKLSIDKYGNEIWLIGFNHNDYTWSNFTNENIINKVFYCGDLI